MNVHFPRDHRQQRIGKGDLLAMPNGLLDIEGVLAREDNPLHEPTPEWLCYTHWDYPFVPQAKCPQWAKFLEEVLTDEDERKLLQEIFGYSLIFDTSFQQFFVFLAKVPMAKRSLQKS